MLLAISEGNKNQPWFFPRCGLLCSQHSESKAQDRLVMLFIPNHKLEVVQTHNRYTVASLSVLQDTEHWKYIPHLKSQRY